MVNQDFLDTFSHRLKKLRKESGLSLEEFCEKFNAQFGTRLNKSTVSRYENAAQEPMVSLVKNMSVFFNVSPDYLLGTNISEPDMIAAHHDDTDWTEAEIAMIEQFKTALRLHRDK